MNKLKYIKTISFKLISLLCFMLMMNSFFSSCSKEENKYNIGKKAYILSLNIDGYPGIINVKDKTINVTIAQDQYDLTNVEPTLELPEGADYSPKGAVDLTEPVEYTVSFGDKTSEMSYTLSVELVGEQYVSFDANSVFFTQPGQLRCKEGNGTGDECNGGKYFDYVEGWKQDCDTLVWGIVLKHKGELKVKPVLAVPESQEGSKIKIILGDQEKTIALKSTGGYDKFEDQESVKFNVENTGQNQLQLVIEKSNDASNNIANVKELKIGGKASLETEPIRRRWRPAAVHCGFSSKGHEDDIEMAVFEVTVKTPHRYAYFPITSSFGYYGSTWVPEKQKFGGVNFSLWSFSAGSNPPPVERFSHLIAVGEGLYIDGFNHEGTGCKARGENPYDSQTGTKQVLALKKEPGNPYDVYYTYYWDFNDSSWKLYGCGKEYNDKALKYLRTGAFVEVPGPPQSQRSGHLLREIHFRGWTRDRAGEWHDINQMTPNGKIEPASYKNWGKTSDGYFYMQMGGFNKILETKPGSVGLTSKHQTPEYLSEENLGALDKLPATIVMEEPSNITETSATLNFKVEEAGTNPKVKIYWGEKDGLTYLPNNKGGAGVVMWNMYDEITIPQNGVVSHKLENLNQGRKYYYRMQIVNDEGETWSWETGSFNTLGEEPTEPIEDLTASLTFKAIDGHKEQDGNVLVFENPYGKTINIDLLVENLPMGYSISDVGTLERADGVDLFRGGFVRNMEISLDGKITEQLVPSSKGFKNFVDLSNIKEVKMGQVHSKIPFKWNNMLGGPKVRATHLFADNYVGCGGWLQYEFTLTLMDKEGIEPVKDIFGNDATATFVIKNINTNPDAKVINLPEFTIKATELENAPKYVKTGYDVAKIWKDNFNTEVPTDDLAWQIQYYHKDNLGFFKQEVNNTTKKLSHAYINKTNGSIERKGNSVDFLLGKGLKPGKYAFRFVVKEIDGERADRKYIVFNYPITVE